jgi:hypothetical protein
VKESFDIVNVIAETRPATVRRNATETVHEIEIVTGTVIETEIAIATGPADGKRRKVSPRSSKRSYPKKTLRDWSKRLWPTCCAKVIDPLRGSRI